MTGRAEVQMNFGEASAYERFMGRWSRAVAPHFLQLIKPRRGATWLDVGCGTGILTETLLDLCNPASVTGIDANAEQIAQASRGPAGSRANFRQANATSLPFPDDSFDYAASALALNFISEPLRALVEMRRVTAPRGTVAGFVWDFGNELSPSGPLRQAMRAINAEVPVIPGTAQSNPEALQSLFLQAGMVDIGCRTIDVTLAYASFEDFWNAQTTSYSPSTRIINAMTEADRRRLKRAVQELLSPGLSAKIEYSARANAIRASVPD